MNLVYGALLLHDSGKEVNEENLKKLTSAVDLKVEEAQIKALVAALDGVDIEEAISKAVSVVAPVAAAPAEGGVPAAQAEEKKEEEEEASEEEAAAGLGALFG